MDIVRIVATVILFISGLFVIGVATFGIFRMRSVLNRIHASSLNMLGAMLILTSCCLMTGISFATLRQLILLIFIWVTNPVVYHMIGRAEVLTNPFLTDEVEVVKK